MLRARVVGAIGEDAETERCRSVYNGHLAAQGCRRRRSIV